MQNTNKLKSYINKLIKEQINKEKNKGNENVEKQNELNNDDLKDLNNNIADNLFPEDKDVENETKISDKHLEKVEDEKINRAVDIIKDLNSTQRKQILDNLKSKAAENNNLPKFKKIIKKVKDVQKLNNIINKLSKAKIEKPEDKKDNETEHLETEKTNEGEEKPKNKIEKYNEDEFVNLAENLINNINMIIIVMNP